MRGLVLLLVSSLACAAPAPVVKPTAPRAAASAPVVDRRAESSSPRHSTAVTTLTYLANEGVLVRRGHHVVVIDGFHRFYGRAYDILEPPEREALETATGQFSEVDLILVSHRHRDHFHPEAVARHLRANPNARLVAPRQAVEELRRERGYDGFADRVDAIEWRPGHTQSIETSGIRVEVMSLHHGGKTHLEVENLGFLVDMSGTTVAHFGDAECSPYNLQAFALQTRDVDVAVVPVWWVTTMASATVVRRHVAADRLFIAHIDPRDRESEARIEAAAVEGQMLREKLRVWPLERP